MKKLVKEAVSEELKFSAVNRPSQKSQEKDIVRPDQSHRTQPDGSQEQRSDLAMFRPALTIPIQQQWVCAVAGMPGVWSSFDVRPRDQCQRAISPHGPAAECSGGAPSPQRRWLGPGADYESGEISNPNRGRKSLKKEKGTLSAKSDQKTASKAKQKTTRSRKPRARNRRRRRRRRSKVFRPTQRTNSRMWESEGSTRRGEWRLTTSESTAPPR